jgi:hypothetical protein
MKTRFLLALVLAVLCRGVVFAQSRQILDVSQVKDIDGTVFAKTIENETETEYPAIMVNVCLLHPKDSSMVKFVTSDEKGYFLIRAVTPGDYLLSFSGLGYHTLYKNVTGNDFRKENIQFGRIQLEESVIALSGVTITANPPEVVVKEDTLEYNPAAFRMQESAVVEDLLKRLPGVDVEPDGKISSGGKEVRRVFVDGKEFFGNDPKMATKNITVNVIDKVQVVTKKSDEAILTGVDDGEEETIINLTIKKGMKKGWLGNVTAGTGATVKDPGEQSPRYSANGMISRFREDSRIALVFNSNNINNQGSTDAGNTARTGMRGSGTARGGITNSNTIGLNATGVISDKLKAGGNVRYNYSDVFVDRTGFRQNMLIDSVSYRKSMSRDQSYSHNLAVDTKMEYTPDSANSVVFSTNFSYNGSSSYDLTAQSTLAGDIDSTKVNASNADTHLSSSGLVFGTELTWSHRFEKKGRRLNFTARTNWNRSSGDGTNLSTSEFFKNPNRNKYLNQDLNTDSYNDSYNFRASYIEPAGTNNTLQLSYNVRYNKTKNLKETYEFDPETGAYSILNPDYSKSLDNNFVNQTIGLTFNSIRTKYSYTAGINIVPSYTRSANFIKNGDRNGNDSILSRIAGRNVINYSPQINFRYRFDSNTNLRFDYRGNTRQPSVTQLDPTPNNTNPLNIRTGNPDLLPAFTNDISFRLNDNRRTAQRSLSVNANFSFTMNEIINFTAYEAETGIQYTSPVNENGSWNTSADVMYYLPLDKAKKLRLSTQMRFGYNNRIGYMTVNRQSERNISGTTSASESLGLSYGKGWFYGQFRGSIRYSNTSNSLEGKANQESYNYGIMYNTQLYLPQNFTLASDINYTANRGLSSGYNKNEILWNASLSKQFLKKKQASLMLQWNDILQQRLNVSRNVTANYIEDSEYNALTSFFIVSLTYRFNTMGGRGNRSAGENRQTEGTRSNRENQRNEGNFNYDRGNSAPGNSR